MNRKFISKSNFVLRKVLNSESNVDVLQDFIEAILKIKIKKIELNPYLDSKAKNLPKEENFGVGDVRVELENGEELNIGIQFIDGYYYVQEKLLLYYAQIHSNQLEHDKYRLIVNTKTINILDFDYFNDDEYHKDIIIADKAGNKMTDELELHVLELKKFKGVKNQYIMTKEEEWMVYLIGKDKNLIQYILKENEKIKKLDNLLETYWKKEKME